MVPDGAQTWAGASGPMSFLRVVSQERRHRSWFVKSVVAGRPVSLCKTGGMRTRLYCIR